MPNSNPLSKLLVSLVLALYLPCLPAQETTVIESVNVVDVEAGRILLNQSVVIENGRIGPVGEDLAVPTGARVIDGSGLYLMPGLWDMHAHIRHPLAATLIFPQFIAHGVTGLREMNSECDGPAGGNTCLVQLQQWQAAIESGELLGPRLLALSSFQINPPWDYPVTEAEIEGLVSEMNNRGVDFIKTYYRLSPQAFAWVVDQADTHDLDVAGHLPLQMTAQQASNLGLDSLEHARDLLFDCFPGSAEFRSAARDPNPPIPDINAMVEGYDAAQCAETFDTFVNNGTAYVPTHITRRMEAFASDDDFRDDPRSRYIWPEILTQWHADADSVVARYPGQEGQRALQGFYTKGLEITGQAHAAGVLVLVGTDSGDSFSFFGSGVHDEMVELTRAGMTNAAVLAAATIRAAEFLGRENDFGSITQGKAADLILLRGNPLESIENIRDIDAVIFAGQYLDRASLDAMLNDVERRVGEL